MFVDPYTGKVRGSRTFGDVTEGRKTFLTFLYRLHFSLALGDVGVWIFGVVAVLWTLDCFVGAYLTFPPARRNGSSAPSKSWLGRWLPAWLLKTSKLFALLFTWHRASGLWVWALLLVFAWSAVALNLGDQVYSPIMNAVFAPEHSQAEHLPHYEPARNTPQLSLRAAHAVGRRLMREEAERRGFQLLGERGLDYSAEHGAYSYTVESSLDISERLAGTTVCFDGDTGLLLAFEAPTGQNANSTITNWLVALHFGAVRVGGLAYRSLVCAMGLLVTLLSVTGVWIWWRKREGRSENRSRRGARQALGPASAEPLRVEPASASGLVAEVGR